MILFLDFDGVLHPIGNAPGGLDNFNKLPMLEAWLRDHDHVNVVISSSWRAIMDLDDMKQLFSEDLRERVISVCPDVSAKPKPFYWRYEEIQAWVNQSGYEGHWLALDDAVNEFPDGFEGLVICESSVGITDDAISDLTAKMMRFNTRLKP
jgi:hypothetical protein